MSLPVKNASEEDNWRAMAFRNRMRAEKAEAERDRWIRLFNRLEAAISHHERHDHWKEEPDVALYKARDSILRAAAEEPTA
jgi:hypothetical protein